MQPWRPSGSRQLSFRWNFISRRLANRKSFPLIFPFPISNLTERSGRTVTLADLRGKIWVANFFYAMCPGPCPVVNGRIAALQDDLLKNDGVRFVSISTDPDSDTPKSCGNTRTVSTPRISGCS